MKGFDVIGYIRKYWYWLIIFIMFLVIVRFYKQLYVNKPIDQTNKIEELRDSVNVLTQDYEDLLLAYENKQTTVVQNITKKNKQNAKDISNIPNLDASKRDERWTTALSQEDSIPWRYWSILEQTTGGRSIKEISLQGRIQEQSR